MGERAPERWVAVDRYLAGALLPADPTLAAVLTACERAGLPPHQVSPAQGMLLHVLARAVGARRVLEIGTLGGYSTIWLARGVAPGGRVVTLEASAAHAAVARSNFALAGVGDAVELRVGPALDTLPALAGEPPFDLVFIDADKPNNPAYLDWALRLTRSGGLILGDNVVRDGAVADEGTADPSTLGVRAFLERLGSEPRVAATAVQTVGEKGYDGFAIAVVR